MKSNNRTCILLICLLFSVVISCDRKEVNRDELIKQNAEEYIKPKLNDPKSYEFAELRLIDSTLYSDNIKFNKESFQDEIESDRKDLRRQQEYRTLIPSMYDKTTIAELRSKIKNKQMMLLEIDSLEKALKQRVNEVASYKYYFSFRGTNSFGAKVLNEYIIQTDAAPSYKVINMTDNKDKLYLSPNNFPGYKEMITKYYGK